MMLNTADIPNLFPADERAEICEKMQNIARQVNRKVESTTIASYNFFIERVRSALHIVLSFSPIGDAFRNRLRMFPSLINCCTIDWFTAWPEDALEMVAQQFLKEVELEDQIRADCVVSIRRNASIVVYRCCFAGHVQNVSRKYPRHVTTISRTTFASQLCHADFLFGIDSHIQR